MNRRTFLRAVPATWLVMGSRVGGTTELAVAHLRIDGMTCGS